MSWYYVDNSGQTQGGFEVSVMKQKYASKELTEESYVWNGTSVNQWTPLKGVDELLKQVKPAPSQSAPMRRPARKSPFGGGGRGDFLKSIQRGATLKKVEPKKEEDKPAPRSGGGGGGGGMDLMAQLRAKQNAMKKKGTIGGSKAGGGAKTGPKPGGAKKTWGNKSTTSSSSGPKKTWGSKNSSTNVTKSSYGGGSSSSRITKIKSKLDSAEDWQLRAIEKILQ